MEIYPTLHELLAHSAKSKELFASFSADTQVALQEQRQNIHTYADLQQIGRLFGRTSHWQ